MHIAWHEYVILIMLYDMGFIYLFLHFCTAMLIACDFDKRYDNMLGYCDMVSIVGEADTDRRTWALLVSKYCLDVKILNSDFEPEFARNWCKKVRKPRIHHAALESTRDLLWIRREIGLFNLWIHENKKPSEFPIYAFWSGNSLRIAFFIWVQCALFLCFDVHSVLHILHLSLFAPVDIVYALSEGECS